MNKDTKLKLSFFKLLIIFITSIAPRKHMDGYGSASMLYNIGQIFCYRKFKIFKKTGVFFYPSNTYVSLLILYELNIISAIYFVTIKIRVWRLSMSESKLFIKTRVGSVEVSVVARNSEASLRKLCNLFWFIYVYFLLQ